VIGLGIFLIFVFSNKPLEGPILIFPDVGQGDSAVIKTENKKIIFLDTGGNVWDENLNKKVYLPLMRKLGAEKIDYLILSHFHPDHSRMVDSLGKQFKVEKIIRGDDLLKFNKDLIIKDDKWKIYIFSGIDDKRENNRSSWTLIEFGDHKMLFTGDTEHDGIDKMLKKVKKYTESISILKVPHHGALSSFNKNLYELKPKFAIITVGNENPWKFPSNELITYLKGKKIKYFKTDVDGEIIFNLNDVRVTTYKSYYGL
jgi:competence protein ComEC